MVDGDVDAVPRGGFASVLLLVYGAAAAVFAAVVADAVVVAVVVSTLTEEKTLIDANPPMEARAWVASNRYSLVVREPRFASQSDEIVG
jgi:hypothetical protein